MLSEATEQKIELFEFYEPSFTKIRMVMKGLGVDRMHAVVTMRTRSDVEGAPE